LGAALLAVLLGERLPEGPRVVLAVLGDDDGERGAGTALTRDGERGDGRDDGEQTHDAHGHILSATAPGAGGIFHAHRHLADRPAVRRRAAHRCQMPVLPRAAAARPPWYRPCKVIDRRSPHANDEDV